MRHDESILPWEIIYRQRRSIISVFITKGDGLTVHPPPVLPSSVLPSSVLPSSVFSSPFRPPPDDVEIVLAKGVGERNLVDWRRCWQGSCWPEALMRGVALAWGGRRGTVLLHQQLLSHNWINHFLPKFGQFKACSVNMNFLNFQCAYSVACMLSKYPDYFWSQMNFN